MLDGSIAKPSYARFIGLLLARHTLLVYLIDRICCATDFKVMVYYSTADICNTLIFQLILFRFEPGKERCLYDRIFSPLSVLSSEDFPAFRCANSMPLVLMLLMNDSKCCF